MLKQENNAEKGSSSGTGSNLPESNSKEKLTASAHANTENLDASNECAPNVAPAPQMPSTVIAQANHNPTEVHFNYYLASFSNSLVLESTISFYIHSL